MQRRTKATLGLTLWSLSSGAGVLWFANLADRGGHESLATAGMLVNGVQLAVAIVGLLVLAMEL